MSEDLESSIWLRNLIAARWDGETPILVRPPIRASISRKNSQDDVHVLHFNYPSAFPPLEDDASLADIPISPAEDSADEKGFHDEERMVDGDNRDAYPSTPILVTLTIALMIAIFMIGLDTNIIGELVHTQVLL